LIFDVLESDTRRLAPRPRLFLSMTPLELGFLMTRLTWLALLMVVPAAIVGCNVFNPPVPGIPSVPGGKTPSDLIGSDFESATPLQLDTEGNAVIAGTIEPNTPDVYDLGPCNPGDRIVVTVDPIPGSQLDPTTAIFDTDSELFALNDDLDLSSGLIGSRIDEVVWVAADHYYLAISKFFFDSQGGDYEGTVRIVRGGIVDAPLPQFLVLNFAGGTADIADEGTFNLDPFDAADIDAVYIGQTDQIKAKIVETVRENYEDTSLQIVTSDDPAPQPGTFSTIWFGGFSATKFGVAETVDQGNRDYCDDGIIFTDNFDKPFVPQPTADEIGIAIGNVAAHEAGHLLGLNHVADVTALMDDTGTASTLKADQEFKTAPLSSTVFPIGLQNAPLLLGRVVPM